MKIIINENERGLLFKNGKYLRMLAPGKHAFFGKGYFTEVLCTSEPFDLIGYDTEVFLADPELAKSLAIAEVPDGSIALAFKNGLFIGALPTGKHIFWAVGKTYDFRIVDITDPLIGNDIPDHLFESISSRLFRTFKVHEHEKGRLYYNGRFVRLLDEGTYRFWNNGTSVLVETSDTRLQQMSIQGQEMLTQDKVTLRVNFVCSFKIEDHIRCFTEIKDFEEQIRTAAQLALREYVGHIKLDELLESKEEMAAFVLEKLKEKQTDFFVSFTDAGVKDIILPGEIRDIMNTVLIAEKRAQANVITRREEVASTRSLLNTAKLLDENETLMRLKEMEYLEKICDNVGSITVNGGSDLLGQLTEIMKRKS